MAVASIDELKEELAFAGDLGSEDNAMMTRHLAAAEGVIDASLGFALATEYPAPETVPAALKQAVLWLAADYYTGRGRVEKGGALPEHVENIVANFREWSF